LSSPLSIKGDAYLLGYLMVKTLWIWSYTKYWRMNDTDLFMMMLRAFIFSDSRLVRMLLDPEPLTNKSLNELVHYCVQRQFGFPSVALESMVTAFEQGGQEEPSGTMFDVENAPWEDPESSRSANGMIAEALEWLGRDGGDKRFLELATVLVQRREAMQIFRRMVDYERGEDGLHTFYNGEFVYGIDKGRLDQIQYSIPVGASGHAELVLCFKPRSGAQFCVLKLESPKLALFEPVARGWSGGLESSNSMGTGTSDEIAKLVRLGVEHAKRRSGQDFARAESLLLPQVERDYLHLALATASNKEAVREKMQEAGFWSLFDGDTVAVERLARLSCWSSLCLTHEGLEWWCDRHGFGFREASEQLLKYCETTGFEFFALNDDGRPLSLA